MIERKRSQNKLQERSCGDKSLIFIATEQRRNKEGIKFINCKENIEICVDLDDSRGISFNAFHVAKNWFIGMCYCRI